MPIHPDVRIGHVHLKVADVERALRFYCDVLGFELMQRFGVTRPLDIARLLRDHDPGMRVEPVGPGPRDG